MKSVLGFLSVLFVSLSAWATLQDEFASLRSVARDYKIVGTVCEEVARLDMEKQYKRPQYTVVTGIAYGDSSRTIGELDVVVFEDATNHAVKLAEVKCWRNLQGGLAKARNQRQRFLKSVAAGGHLFFQSTSDRRQYGVDQFKGVRDFITIAQAGGKEAGFDQELAYPLEELMQLRQMMLDCQASGGCPRP